MGRKGNNIPIRKLRKKKIKDPKNEQVKGKAGRGRKRVTGKANRIRDKIEGKGKHAKVKVAKTVEIKQEQVSWIDLAKAQESKVLAERDGRKGGDVEPAKLSKRARKRQRAREVEQDITAQDRPAPMERSFAPGGGVRRGTVEFGFFDDDHDEAPGSAPTPSASSAAAPEPAPAKNGEGLSVGARAAVIGLRNAPALNGRLGTCVRWDAERQRWLVRLERGGEEKLLKAENLRLYVAPPTAALCPFASVRIKGLLGSVALNDRLATCRSFDTEKGRWLVDLGDGAGEKLLRPENLEPVLQRGSSVRVLGLTGATELNGRLGCCVSHDDARKRWRVRLDGGEVSPVIRQSVVMCGERGKALEFVHIMKQRREAEKRGGVWRDRILVFCGSAATQATAMDALKQNQFTCVSLDGRREMKEVLARFSLDDKQVLHFDRGGGVPAVAAL